MFRRLCNFLWSLMFTASTDIRLKQGCMIRLVAKTSHGYDVIDEAGEYWGVTTISDDVACCGGEGTALMLESYRRHADEIMWVLLNDDPDFEVYLPAEDIG